MGWLVGGGPCSSGSWLRSIGQVEEGQARSWRPVPPVASAGPGPVVVSTVQELMENRLCLES